MTSIVSLFGATAADGSELVFPDIAYSAVIPQLILIGGALVLLLLSSLFRDNADSRAYASYTALVGFAAMVSAVFVWKDATDVGPTSAFQGSIARDHFSLFFVITISVALILSAVLAERWLRKHDESGPEFYVLSMLSAAGGMMMAAANDLIVVFLGLEILSLALYVLAAFNRSSERSREAALKYFVLGAFSSAIFLYGIALVYGATGSTNLTKIAAFLSQNTLFEDGLLVSGLVLLIVGLAFKVAAAPFHQWTPDVYQGSPTPVVAFMAAVAKAAGFAAFARIFIGALYTAKLDWQPVLLVLAILTLFVGSIAACMQRDVKRMLAYSSISHAGYILLGLQTGSIDGLSGALYYVFAYTFMAIGTFAIVNFVAGDEDRMHDIDDYKGVAARHPIAALCLAVLLLAQAGLPPTSGFLAKFYVISAQVKEGEYAVAVIAMLAAAIAAYFYLRIAFKMYAPADGVDVDAPAVEPTPAAEAITSEPHAETSGGVATDVLPSLEATTAKPVFIEYGATWVVVAICVGLTVAFGVFPQDWLNAIEFARKAAEDIFPTVSN